MFNFSNPLSIAVILLAVIVVALFFAILSLHSKLKKFLIGIKSEKIEDSLAFTRNSLDHLEMFRNDTESKLREIESKLSGSIRSVHTVRFNPFQGTGSGGNQSFATAFLDETGNGVIISSLYFRDHVSVFSKPIHGFKPEHELSEEEQQSLDEAKKKITT